MELRHPSSIEATLHSPKTFQQLGSLFCARLRDNSRLLDHLQSWLSYGSSTSSTLATLVSWSLGKVLFIQHCAVGKIFLMSNFFFTRWLPGFAFSLVLICYEELRKAISRLVNGHYSIMKKSFDNFVSCTLDNPTHGVFSFLQETSRSLGGQRDSILDLERQWYKRLS